MNAARNEGTSHIVWSAASKRSSRGQPLYQFCVGNPLTEVIPRQHPVGLSKSAISRRLVFSAVTGPCEMKLGRAQHFKGIGSRQLWAQPTAHFLDIHKLCPDQQHQLTLTGPRTVAGCWAPYLQGSLGDTAMPCQQKHLALAHSNRR